MVGQYPGAVPAIVPDDDDLPGWVPKNYIEKGTQHDPYIYHLGLGVRKEATRVTCFSYRVYARHTKSTCLARSVRVDPDIREAYPGLAIVVIDKLYLIV